MSGSVEQRCHVGWLQPPCWSSGGIFSITAQTTRRPACAAAPRVSGGSDELRHASDDGWAWPNQRRSRPNAAGQPSYRRRGSRTPPGGCRGLSTPVSAAERGLHAEHRRSASRARPSTMPAAGQMTWRARTAPRARSTPAPARRGLAGAARAGRCRDLRRNYGRKSIYSTF